MITKEMLIEAAKQVDVKPVEVAGIDGCFVRECTRSDMKWALDKKTTDEEAEERLVCVSVCDSSGNQLLTRDDVAVVKNFGYQKVRTIAQAALAVNGLSKEDEPEKN